MAITLNGSTGITTDIDGDESLTLNRDTSDGDIITLQKDNSAVGSIGIESTGFYVDGEAGHSGLKFRGFDVIPRDNGADIDNGVNLGGTGVRFKDLYLSGGVYVGGTGSANYLDDYEEGTWTPIISDATSGGNTATSYSVNDGRYTKVGNQVTVNCFVTNFVTTGMTSSSGIYIQGFPFATDSDTHMTAAVYNTRSSNGGYTGGPIAYMTPSTTYCSFRFFINDTSSNTYLMQVGDNASGSADFIFTATYICAN